MTAEPVQGGVDLSGLLTLEARERTARCAGLPARALATQCIEQLQQLALQDLERAIEASEWVIACADASEDESLRVQARTAAAFALSLGNRYQDAMDLLDATNRWSQSLDPVMQGRVAQARVQPLARLGRLTEASAAAESAIERFEAGDAFMLAAKARANLGIVLRMREEPAAALRAFDQALAYLSDQAGAVAQIQNNRAEALLELACFAEAEAAFRAAILAFAAGGVTRAAAIAEGNLADLLGMQGKIAGALRHFEHARRALEDGQAPGDAARLATERAEVLSAVGLPSEAADVCFTSIDVLDRAGLANEGARARLAAAVALVRANRLDEAERHAAEAAARFAAQGATKSLAKANVLLAQIESARGRHDEALAILTDACATLRDWPNESVRARTLHASILVAAEQFEGALRAIDELLPQVERLGLVPLRADLLHLRARVFAKQGKVDAAIDAACQALVDVERLRGLLQADRLRAAWLGDRMALYSDLVEMHLQRRDRMDVAAAFHVLEQGRSRSLLDLIDGTLQGAEAFATDGGDAELMRQLASHQADLNALYSTLDRSNRTPDEQLGMHQSRMRKLERDIAVIEGRLAESRQLAPIFATPIELSSIQASLAETSAIVSYFQAGAAIGAFVVRAEHVQVVPGLCSVERVEALTRRLTFQLNRSIAEPSPAGRAKVRIDRELAALYDLLLAPIRSMLQGLEHLTFLPDGAMFCLPFGLLRDEGRYLIERFDLSVAPSASIACRMAHAVADRGGERALVVGVADQVAPQIADEAAVVAQAIPGAQLLADEAATARAFLTKASGASLIHLACHGHFSATDPLESRFKLADRWVTAREIFGLDLHGATVVLSCCDLGRNRVAPGSEIFGVTRAFLASGVSALVTSLWPAHDQTTRALMQDLYGHLVRGGSVTASLAAAQRGYAPTNASPAQWGHLCVVGMAT